MNLLTDIKIGDPISTKKLSIQGKTDLFPVYRVPIEYLIYNKKNGRIATYVSQFIDEGREFPVDNIDEFNNIIEDYIEKSNPDALKKTKANIKIMSQTEPAVVMANGIVLDGNRRFTSLRQLHREGAGAEFAYLEAVVLDGDSYTEKDIKRLELNLQHAVESRVDYNPIDRLVDIYRDLIEEGASFTPTEYATETQIPLKKVQEEIEISKLMIDYLDYIGQPFKFYIAREQKIDGPIREIYKILKSNKIDSEDKDDIKDFLFINIMALEGDVTRRIRELKHIFEDKKMCSELLEELDSKEILDDATDYYNGIDEKNDSVELSVDITNKVRNLTETFVERKKFQNARNQPVEMLNKAYLSLQEVDVDALARLDEPSRQEFSVLIEKVNDLVDELREG